jgi:hypothetical protein
MISTTNLTESLRSDDCTTWGGAAREKLAQQDEAAGGGALHPFGLDGETKTHRAGEKLPEDEPTPWAHPMEILFKKILKNLFQSFKKSIFLDVVKHIH